MDVAYGILREFVTESGTHLSEFCEEGAVLFCEDMFFFESIVELLLEGEIHVSSRDILWVVFRHCQLKFGVGFLAGLTGKIWLCVFLSAEGFDLCFFHALCSSIPCLLHAVECSMSCLVLLSSLVHVWLSWKAGKITGSISTGLHVPLSISAKLALSMNLSVEYTPMPKTTILIRPSSTVFPFPPSIPSPPLPLHPGHFPFTPQSS